MSVEAQSTDHAIDLVGRLDAAWIDIERALRVYLSQYVRSQHDVSDVVQDTYVRLRTMRTTPIGDLRGYAFAVARNLVMDWQRSRTRHHALDESLLDDLQLLETPGGAPSPEQLYSTEQELKAILQAFNQLPAATQLAFVAYLQGDRLSSVAAQLGIDPRSVQRNVCRVHQHIRDRLRRLHGDRE